MGQVKSMDEAKFKRLLEEHHSSAFGWAVYCSDGDRSEAEDLLQSVYLKLLEKPGAFEGRSSFKTWLFTIIRRTAFRRRFRARRQLQRMKDAFVSIVVPDRSENRYFQSQLRSRVTQMLEQLSPRQREVLQLVFYQELTIEEASEVMGVSLGSARTHYERGKGRLREEMMKAGISDELSGRRSGNQAAV